MHSNNCDLVKIKTNFKRNAVLRRPPVNLGLRDPNLKYQQAKIYMS